MSEKLRILVLGSSGLIGIPLCNMLKNQYNVFTTYHKTKLLKNDLKFDILDKENIKKNFSEVKPDIVINLCGIYKNIEFCENNKELVMAINGESLRHISRFSNQHDAYLISMSSDFVFDGEKGNYKESDRPSPYTFYGKSRLIGEKHIQNIAKNFCIVRTSMIYGKNFVRTTLADLIYESVSKGKSLELINDQFMTPTYLHNFCSMLKEVIEKEIQGLIHLAGPERLSKYEFGKKLANIMGFSEQLLTPISKENFHFSYKFPKDTSLNIEKANSLLNNKPEKIECSIKDYFDKNNLD